MTEHIRLPLQEAKLSSAGTAVITTAESLTEGTQEYCMLFRNNKQTVMVGYEGNLYTYEPVLKSDECDGESVRIVTKNENDNETSPAKSCMINNLQSRLGIFPLHFSYHTLSESADTKKTSILRDSLNS